MFKVFKNFQLIFNNSRKKDSVDYLNIGNQYLASSDFEAAIDAYEKKIKIDPEKPAGYTAMGYVLSEMGQWDKAIFFLEKAFAFDSSSDDAKFMLGNAYLKTQRLEDAENIWRKAFQSSSKIPQLYENYFLLLYKINKKKDAGEVLSQAVNFFPENDIFYFYFGNYYYDCGMYAEAVAYYKKSIDNGFESSGVIANYGSALLQTGNLKEAIFYLNMAMEMLPNSSAVMSNYLLAIQYDQTKNKKERYLEALKFSEKFENPIIPFKFTNYFSNCSDKIKIGYISGDFRNHSLAYFIEPILKKHNKKIFEIYCYSNSPYEDEVTLRLKKTSDFWIDVSQMSDEDLAEKIHKDGINILIDLSGHTGYNRLLAFAKKPAPVQMTWLGYQATTGMKSIDYRITEEGLDPSGISEEFHSEELIRLSSSGAFKPLENSPPVSILPALRSEYFTYGCLNNPSKINDNLIKVWSRILLGNEKSRIMLGNVTESLRESYFKKFEENGISSDRLLLKNKLNILDYLSLHNEIDLSLDTFPYNGGTTTYHSLWMGVPIVAIDGETALSKVGFAIMQGLGLEKFCNKNIDEYVACALYFSKNINELSLVRNGLRDIVHDMNEQLSIQVTRSLEKAYELCWKKYLMQNEK